VLTAEQLTRMSRLLDEALPLDRESRRRWLDTLAPEHADLKPALDRILFQSKDDPYGAAVSAVLPSLARTGVVNTIVAGAHIGPYELIRQLGAGGMAEVWLARRADGAFKRDVALKLPALSRLREDLERRFARERDILAALEHPNIARLYDAGIDPGGLPYIAMEYVAGRPLTLWCDERRLPVRERVALFLQVLDAVQYAHERRVLHRDIKPSNILVSEDRRVRLLDFGVAKLLADQPQDTQLTQIYGQALTPEYASPELLLGEPAGEAGDIYALGVVLNELLCGSRPYRLHAGASRTLLERAVVEARIEPASVRITKDAAAARDTTPERLTRQLRGDLDAIVLKALAKRPQDRYPDANAFGQDLRRHLEGGAVQARYGRLVYRIGKFLLRHRTETAAAAGALIAAIALAVVLARLPLLSGAAAPTRTAEGTATPFAVPAGEHSIAVLPFRDMSEKKDQEYFSDGLSEELIDRLAQNPDLRVIARTSSFQFKDRNEDVRAIGHALGVANVLEGSVRRSGNQMRVTTQLIRASDGSHLWSNTYERAFGEIFQLQDEIAATVARALQVTLGPGAAARRGRTVNAQAYNLLLQGNYVADHNTRPDSERAIALYHAALQADPEYALAWAKIAHVSIQQTSIGWVSPADGTAVARDAVQRALRIDPDLAYAHRMHALLLEEFDWDWQQAASEYRRGLELNPSDLHARIGLADLKAIRAGSFDERIEYSRQLLESDPLDSDERWSIGWMLLGAGQFEEARAALRKLVELNPSYAGGPSFLALSLLLLNRPAEALTAVQTERDETFRMSTEPAVYWTLGERAKSDEVLARLEAKYANSSAYNIAEIYAWRGDRDHAFAWLHRARQQHDPGMEMVRIDPLLRNLRPDPRFQAVLAQMKLAE